MKSLTHPDKLNLNTHLKKRNSVKEVIFHSSPQRKFTFNSEFLAQNSVVSQDKRSKMISCLNQDFASDFSVYSQYSSMKSPSLSPTEFPKAENIYRIDTRAQSKIEYLDQWLTSMKNTHIPEIDAIIRRGLVPRSEITKKVEDLYGIALNEIIKQVAASNKLRAQLLENVVATLRYVWNKYPQHLNFLLEKEKEYSESKCEDIELKFREKIEKYKQRNRVCMAKVRRLEEEREMMEKEIRILKKSGLDYKEEISSLVRYSRKEQESVGVQVDFGVEVWPGATQALRTNLKRFNTVYEKSNSSEILKKAMGGLEHSLENQEEIRIKIVSELKGIVGNKKGKTGKANLENLAQSVLEQKLNISGWIEGFKVGFKLMRKESKNSLLKSPKVNTAVKTAVIKNKNTSNGKLVSDKEVATQIIGNKDD